MPTPDKLYGEDAISVEDIKAISFSARTVTYQESVQLANRLLDTMREVERLRTALTDIVKYLTVEEYWSSEDVERMAKDALQPSKPIDTNIVYCGYCEGTGKMPCDMYNGTGIHDNPPQNRVCEHNVPWGMNCGMCQESPTTS